MKNSEQSSLRIQIVITTGSVLKISLSGISQRREREIVPERIRRRR